MNFIFQIEQFNRPNIARVCGPEIFLIVLFDCSGFWFEVPSWTGPSLKSNDQNSPNAISRIGDQEHFEVNCKRTWSLERSIEK